MSRTLSQPEPQVKVTEDFAPETLQRASRTFRLAYLTTEYPKVSHTFIRREIRELERRGHNILRLAIRDSGGAVADSIDQEEAKKTFHCLNQPLWRFAQDLLLTLILCPLKFIRALLMSLKMGVRSDRGMIRHLAYLVEATVLARKLRDEQIDHVHVHFGTNAATVARLINCLGGPTYSMTIHGPGDFDSPRGIRLGEKIADALFVVGISNYCVSQLCRWASYEHWTKIHMIRCSVGEDFHESSSPISDNCLTMVNVGRLTPQKGQLLLIDSLKELIDEGYDAKLILVGDGELRNEIEKRIALSHLTEHVEITGWVDESTVKRHLRSARALVQPSFAEGLPVVIMEAMAASRPVIASMITGVPELVRPNENGWLVTVGNREALVEAMRELCDTPVKRLNEMGNAGRELVSKQHSTALEVARLDELFTQYVSNRNH